MQDKEQMLNDLLAEVQFLPMEFSDLGWDGDGMPDGELCDKFDDLLQRLVRLAQAISNKN
jgi:hypothetical protein